MRPIITALMLTFATQTGAGQDLFKYIYVIQMVQVDTKRVQQEPTPYGAITQGLHYSYDSSDECNVTLKSLMVDEASSPKTIVLMADFTKRGFFMVKTKEWVTRYACVETPVP